MNLNLKAKKQSSGLKGNHHSVALTPSLRNTPHSSLKTSSLKTSLAKSYTVTLGPLSSSRKSVQLSSAAKNSRSPPFAAPVIQNNLFSSHRHDRSSGGGNNLLSKSVSFSTDFEAPSLQRTSSGGLLMRKKSYEEKEEKSRARAQQLSVLFEQSSDENGRIFDLNKKGARVTGKPTKYGCSPVLNTIGPRQAVKQYMKNKSKKDPLTTSWDANRSSCSVSTSQSSSGLDLKKIKQQHKDILIRSVKSAETEHRLNDNFLMGIQGPKEIYSNARENGAQVGENPLNFAGFQEGVEHCSKNNNKGKKNFLTKVSNFSSFPRSIHTTQSSSQLDLHVMKNRHRRNVIRTIQSTDSENRVDDTFIPGGRTLKKTNYHLAGAREFGVLAEISPTNYELNRGGIRIRHKAYECTENPALNSKLTPNEGVSLYPEKKRKVDKNAKDKSKGKEDDKARRKKSIGRSIIKSLSWKSKSRKYHDIDANSFC